MDSELETQLLVAKTFLDLDLFEFSNPILWHVGDSSDRLCGCQEKDEGSASAQLSSGRRLPVVGGEVSPAEAFTKNTGLFR